MKKGRKIFLLACLVLGVIVSSLSGFWLSSSLSALSVQSVPAKQTVVLDAGHGGEDGGAVSISGQVESNLNLAIALRLDQLFGLYGVPVEMLRSEDRSLHDREAETLRQKKVSDLHNRAARVEEVENATLISIHQNSFPEAYYHGAQVFFADTEGSEALAVQTQDTLRQIDPSNTRQAAKVAGTVYLMNHVSCRAILVECGFLTNVEEEAKLISPKYQTQLAAALCSAFLQEEQK